MIDFSEIWVYIVSVLGGVSVAGILTAVIYGCLKGAFNRLIQKINVEKITEKATEKGIDRIKKISFTQTIQPLVESELKKVTEQANKYIKTELANVQVKYDKLIAILEALSSYFDNSIAVSEQSKADLKQAIQDAKNDKIEVQEIVLEPNKKEKSTITAEVETITQNNIER